MNEKLKKMKKNIDLCKIICYTKISSQMRLVTINHSCIMEVKCMIRGAPNRVVKNINVKKIFLSR